MRQEEVKGARSSFLPIPVSLMPPISLSPPSGLDNGTFPLSAQHMYDLQRYVYTGVLLPVTITEYQQEVSLSDDGLKRFESNVTGILRVYSNMRKHSKHFKDNIFPNTVALASALYDYAQGVDIYYTAIAEALEKLEELTEERGSEFKIKKQKRTVNVLVDREVAAVDKMSKSAKQVIEDLNQFAKDTLSDKVAAQRQEKSIRVVLAQNNHDIKALQGQVKYFKALIATEEKTFNDTIDKITNVAKWGWIPIIGWVPAALLLTIYGITAVKNVVKALGGGDDLTATQAKLATYSKMALQGENVVENLERALKLIEPAIKTIESMQGYFDAVGSDLLAVKKLVNDNLRKPSDILHADIKHVNKKWEALGKRADRYRQVAYISPVDIKALAEKANV